MTKRRPILVAIVGGSGAGKTWVAGKLQAALSGHAVQISLDAFYRDRSHLSPARRSTLNFDRPRAIDWAQAERVVRRLLAGRPARLPCYDFKTHCRLPTTATLQPKPVILMDGLWLCHRPSFRRLFALKLFLDCSTRTRLRRRLRRDLRSRARTRASVEKQFWTTVEPMHRKYVAPQVRWADLVLKENRRTHDINRIATWLRKHFQAQVPPTAAQL